jgi:alpha-ribazole phosphatase/probable phosphoglycerate mutase
MQIVFETHSISTDNEAGIATGWLDGALSPAGRDQARRLGERRRCDAIDSVLVSDLGRAVETAQIAFADSGLHVRRDRRLRECDYGDWNGMPVAQLEGQRSAHVDVPFPGGQSYREVCRQMAPLLDELREGRHGRRVLLVGHSATRWALDHLIDGAPLEQLVDAPFAWREGWEYRWE